MFDATFAEAVPDAVAVMDPFHVVALAGDALGRCRQRVQQQTCGHRGRTGDPLCGIRRVLRTGVELLTDRQHQGLTAVFATEQHVEVEATWGIYQRIVAANRNPDRASAKTDLAKTITVISAGVPTALTELITLGRTLKRRAADVLAYFDRAGTSNGRPKRSTAASNTYAAPRWASATSPATSQDHYSRLAGSDHNYTLRSDEPGKFERNPGGVSERGGGVRSRSEVATRRARPTSRKEAP